MRTTKEQSTLARLIAEERAKAPKRNVKQAVLARMQAENPDMLEEAIGHDYWLRCQVVDEYTPEEFFDVMEMDWAVDFGPQESDEDKSLALTLVVSKPRQ